MRHDPMFARWTGIWPGIAEAAMLGLYVKWTDHGWEKCDASDPLARPSLNDFYDMGYNKIFFIKPSVDRGAERYEEKQEAKNR